MNLYKTSQETYADIFNQRGADYHNAMKLIPGARDLEFLNLLDRVSLKDEMVIVDIPSGGNYLANYINQKVQIKPLETSEVFANLGNSKVCNWAEIPLEDNSADIIFCCAAFHHVIEEDRKKFMKEASRILKNDGKLVIADVKLGSSSDHFLNDFVDSKNSLGHQGVFMDHNFAATYQLPSLISTESKYVQFPWVFSENKETAIEYLKLMFGLDLASSDEIENEIVNSLNFSLNTDKKFQIDWALNYEVFTRI